MSQTGIPQPRIDAAIALLKGIEREFKPAALANSLGAEDMLLTELIVRHAPGIEIFTLDTGRLHDETYALMQRLADRYDRPLRVYFPQPQAVEHYVGTHGINAFYENVELRKACCQIRKVEPLTRALAGKRAWITGLRRAQSVTRGELAEQEFDAALRIAKFNPLAAWSEDEVWACLRAFGVPTNPLHDRGYPSIGCAPCTRALAIGEDLRAGRWWWEGTESRECGLHPRRTARAAINGNAGAPLPDDAARQRLETDVDDNARQHRRDRDTACV